MCIFLDNIKGNESKIVFGAFTCYIHFIYHSKKKKKKEKKKEAKAGSEGGLNLLKSQLSCRQRFGQGPGFLKLDLF